MQKFDQYPLSFNNCIQSHDLFLSFQTEHTTRCSLPINQRQTSRKNITPLYPHLFFIIDLLSSRKYHTTNTQHIFTKIPTSIMGFYHCCYRIRKSLLKNLYRKNLALEENSHVSSQQWKTYSEWENFLHCSLSFTPELPDLTASKSSRECTALNCFPCAPVDHSYTCSAEQR